MPTTTPPSVRTGGACIRTHDPQEPGQRLQRRRRPHNDDFDDADDE